MVDITSPRLLIFKGALFILTGLLAAGLLLALHPGWREALLLGITIWAFARAYYFAFYVIEKYIDPGYKFAGIGSALKFLWRTRFARSKSAGFHRKTE